MGEDFEPHFVREEELARKWDWVGCIVKTRRPMKNGLGRVPAGSLAIVRYQHGGASLSFRPCDGCGTEMIMTKVGLESLEPHVKIMETPSYRDNIYSNRCPKLWEKYDEWRFRTFQREFLREKTPLSDRKALFREMVRQLLVEDRLTASTILDEVERVMVEVKRETQMELPLDDDEE